MLEVVATIKKNRLHAGYRALVELGMRIVRAEVRTVGRHVIQKLYLGEADERELSSDRLFQAREALQNVHGPTRLLEPRRRNAKPRAKPLRIGPPFIGAVRWQR